MIFLLHIRILLQLYDICFFFNKKLCLKIALLCFKIVSFLIEMNCK